MWPNKVPLPFNLPLPSWGGAVGSQVGPQYGRGEHRLGNHGYSGKAFLSREETWRVHMLSYLSQDTLRTLTTCHSPHRVSCLTQLLGSSQTHHATKLEPQSQINLFIISLPTDLFLLFSVILSVCNFQHRVNNFRHSHTVFYTSMSQNDKEQSG